MNTLTSDDIHSRLLVAKLPSPPQTLIKLMQLCQDENAGIKELTDLITLDPALSAKVLAVAHSAAYHRADASPLTLQQASNRLGTELIKVLVIAEMVVQTFNTFTSAGRMDLRHFWKHSLSVALIAKELAHKLDDAAAEEAYLAGLLHDIGRLALAVALPQPSQTLLTNRDDEALGPQEQQQLGMTHTEAGAWLLRRWHLSDALVESVLRHHEANIIPSKTPVLTRLVHLAHRLAALPLKQPDAAANFAGASEFSATDLMALLQSAEQQVAQTAHDLGLDISNTDTAAPATLAVEPAPAVDAQQTQMAQAVFDRSVLNEMAMHLIGRNSNESAMRHLRKYASALLQLENSVVMLSHSNQQQLLPVSMNECHAAAAKFTYDMAKDVVFARCVSSAKVVFAGRTNRCAIPLLNVLDANELVLIPLISARHCMGVLAAAVPAESSAYIHSIGPLLQAFGTYAGLALSRRRQTNMAPQTLAVISKQELKLSFIKMAREFGKQVDPLGSVDLCLAINELVQRIKDSRLLPGHAKIQCQLSEQPVKVRGSKSMVQLIALLLINNAMERMSRECDIVINAGAMAYRNGIAYCTLSLSDANASSSQLIQTQLSAHSTISTTSEAYVPGLADVSLMVEKLRGHLGFKAGASSTRFDVLLPTAKALKLVA